LISNAVASIAESEYYMALTLQPFTPEWQDQLLQLCPAPDQVDFLPPVTEVIAEVKQFSQTRLWIAVDNACPVGYVVLARFAGVHWITRLLVDQQHQRKGYGQKILRLAIQQLRQQNRASEIRTGISRNNIVAQYLFEKMGFKVINTQTNDPQELFYTLIF
jgi:diamine N-acetyltransferase